jgi:hypothetical protein
MLYRHYSLVPWDKNRWPNFHPSERNIHCPCCGEFFFDPFSFDALQALRRMVDRPIKINSGHRCRLHNARVGGKPRSMHKYVAFDVSLRGHDLQKLYRASHNVGFRGFGYYATFLHLDTGRKRFWITEGGKRTWIGLIY